MKMGPENYALFFILFIVVIAAIGQFRDDFFGGRQKKLDQIKQILEEEE